MGAAVIASVASSTLSTGLGIYKDYNNKIRNKASNDIQNRFKISELMMENESENFKINKQIKSELYSAEKIRSDFKLQNSLIDHDDKNMINSKKADYLTSGVELSGSALDVIEGIENQVSTARFLRSKLADDEAIKRERIANNLLYDIETNNILTKYKIGKSNLNTKYSNKNIDSNFTEDSFLSILNLGGQSTKKMF